MADMAEGLTLVRELTGERSHGSRVSTCRRQGHDLAGEVVAAGLARDCMRYSRSRYAAAETPAGRHLPLPAY